jgi:CubicO group peptidase (beta-lactamase class C family)
MNVDQLCQTIAERGVAPLVSAGCAALMQRSGTPRATDSPGVGGELTTSTRWVREVGGATTFLFDLASVTKPMTALAVARAGIDRTAPLGKWVAEARGTASEGVSLELLLAHRAGLASHRTLYGPLLQGGRMDVVAALREAADARRPDAQGEVPPQGFAPLYSDLGYALAGEALARAVGARDAGEAIARLVLEPLGITPAAGTIRELAARGVHGPFAPTEKVPWRGGIVAGAVHDENAWALTGYGGSGHAGVFATVDALLSFGTAVLDELDGGAFRWLVEERPGGTLRAGFDGKSLESSSAGSRMGAHSFGHLGFTGTSLWIDPDAKVAVVLLTNRVSPSRQHLAIREARPCAHDALFERAVLIRGRG